MSAIPTLDPKIVGLQLQKARKAKNLTQEKAGDKVGMARTTVIAIEQGERKVTGSELMKFAAVYGTTVGELVKVPVTLDDFVPQFRISERSDETQAAAAAAAKELSKRSKAYMELEALTEQKLVRRYPAPFPLEDLRVSVEQAAENCAYGERTRLGFGDGPLIYLRARLETDVGLRVFSFPMKGRLAGIFGYTDSMGGCIAVNSNHPVERRRWSLAHEYGHFMSTRFDVDYDALGSRGRSISEKFADNFAKFFLLPTSGVNRLASEIQMRNGQLTLADVCTIADHFKVSLQAMVLRLEELSRVKGGTWDSLVDRGLKVKKVKEYLGLKPDDTPEDSYPVTYRNLAIAAYQAEKITEGQFAEYLGIPIMAARTVYRKSMEQLVDEESEGFGIFAADFKQVLS